jgi:hypothetical protein
MLEHVDQVGGSHIGGQARGLVVKRLDAGLLGNRALLSAYPRGNEIRPGTRAALHIPDVGVINLTFRPDGTILARSGHRVRYAWREYPRLS